MKTINQTNRIAVVLLSVILALGFTSPLFAAQKSAKKAPAKKAVPPKETAEDCYNKWLAAYDKGDYEKSIPYMKKAIDLDPSYAPKFREYIEKSEVEIAASVDVEKKRREVLAQEKARELDQKRRSSQRVDLVSRRPLKFGPLTMHPYINYSMTYDDNIYLTQHEKVGDILMDVAPGLDAKLDLPFALPFISGGGLKAGMGSPDRTLIDLEYRPDFNMYCNTNRLNNVGHNFITTAVVPSNLFGGRGKLIFGFKDVLNYSTQPPTDDQLKYVTVMTNVMEAKAKYTPTEKISLAIGGKGATTWYPQSSMKNYRHTDYSLTPAIYYNMTPKSALFADSDLGQIAYGDGDRDSIYVQFSGGATGQITAKTNLYFKAGAQLRQYQHKDEGYRNYYAFTAKGILTAQLRRDVVMRIILAKEPVESTYQDNAYFDAKYIDMEIVKNLTGKAALMIGGNFGRNDYETGSVEVFEDARTRHDNVWGARAGLSYQFLKWLDAGVTYQLSGRDSNFNRFCYRDNKVVMNVKAVY